MPLTQRVTHTVSCGERWVVAAVMEAIIVTYVSQQSKTRTQKGKKCINNFIRDLLISCALRSLTASQDKDSPRVHVVLSHCTTGFSGAELHLIVHTRKTCLLAERLSFLDKTESSFIKRFDTNSV